MLRIQFFVLLLLVVTATSTSDSEVTESKSCKNGCCSGKVAPIPCDRNDSVSTTHVSAVTVSGSAGVPGKEGERGAKGEKGMAGKIGPKGIQGERGARGLTGPSGPAGILRINECSTIREGMMRFNKKTKEVEYCDDNKWFPLPQPSSFFYQHASSCKQIALNYKSMNNGQYWIRPSVSDLPFQVFCDTIEGWTMIMKIDGNQQNFKYDSELWSNKKTFQSNSLDLDDKETKLASWYDQMD
ncbi:conglutinin-like [Corticium candelabrum]|uniref:conglutinin-like n=1 Tax=Corticium candelabrum TaxID=121492 RepID=UPI002E26A5C9|nr:conglutinin-like [Corticium candelabrum]